MDLTPAQISQQDQHHAAALADLEVFVGDARRLIAEHGPQLASHHLVGELLEAAAGNAPYGTVMLAGTAALALIELARREST